MMIGLGECRGGRAMARKIARNDDRHISQVQSDPLA